MGIAGSAFKGPGVEEGGAFKNWKDGFQCDGKRGGVQLRRCWSGLEKGAIRVILPRCHGDSDNVAWGWLGQEGSQWVHVLCQRPLDLFFLL